MERLTLDKDLLLAVEDQSKVDEGSKCVICLTEMKITKETIVEEQTLAKLPNCGHIFHEACLGSWKTYSCPICRKPGTSKYLNSA